MGPVEGTRIEEAGSLENMAAVRRRVRDPAPLLRFMTLLTTLPGAWDATVGDRRTKRSLISEISGLTPTFDTQSGSGTTCW